MFIIIEFYFCGIKYFLIGLCLVCLDIVYINLFFYREGDIEEFFIYWLFF